MGMKLLREYVRTMLSEVTDVGKPFDLNVLRGMTDVFDMEDYLSTYDPRAREGQGRSVYDVGHGYVVKLARPHSGGARQNKQEAKLATCAPRGAPVVSVLEVGHGFKWIMCTKVEPVTGDGLTHALNATVGLNEISELMDVVHAGVENGLYPDESDRQHPDDWVELVPRHEELYKTNEWYKGLFDTVRSCRLDAAELHGGNWGLDSDGRLVLLDAGG